MLPDLVEQFRRIRPVGEVDLDIAVDLVLEVYGVPADQGGQQQKQRDHCSGAALDAAVGQLNSPLGDCVDAVGDVVRELPDRLEGPAEETPVNGLPSTYYSVPDWLQALEEPCPEAGLVVQLILPQGACHADGPLRGPHEAFATPVIHGRGSFVLTRLRIPMPSRRSRR